MFFLWISFKFRKTGELKRIYCRVVQYTRGGYQVNTHLDSSLVESNMINWIPTVDSEASDSIIPRIEKLSISEADKEKKITLTTAMSKMNNRQIVQTTQRAGQKRNMERMATRNVMQIYPGERRQGLVLGG